VLLRCLGKNFAVLEMKAILGVLLRKYSFELLYGPETRIDEEVATINRPKVESEPGTQVPMRIRRVEWHDIYPGK
jgi:cytochrome P450